MLTLAEKNLSFPREINSDNYFFLSHKLSHTLIFFVLALLFENVVFYCFSQQIQKNHLSSQ